jgi:molybdopterin synthase sulfur carrier subunit
VARLRLFAAARDVAGTARAELEGATVGEVLDAAVARFGDDLAAVITASRVWCNGEPATRDDPVGEDDEVAVLPPVSGGQAPAVAEHRRAGAAG